MSARPPFTILCVDDADDNRLAVSVILQHAGYRVLEAASGRRALEYAPLVDLVILDVRLPDLNGLEICQRLKASAETAFTPVILLSGHFTRSEHKAEGLEGGGDVYLTKPVDARELLGQVKALLRIREAELMLRHQAEIIDQIHDGVFATDRAGCVTRWNRGAERIFGYFLAEMAGKTLDRLDPADPAGQPTLAALLERVATQGGLECDLRQRRSTGEEVRVQLSLSPLHDRYGKESGVIGYARDVTEQKRLEEQYRQALKMETVGKLAGGIAHEFNNLMTVVNGYSYLLLNQLQEADPARALVAPIATAGERAAALTRQLLAFSSKAMVQPQPLDLNAIVERLGERLKVVAGTEVELVTELEPALDRVAADAGQIEDWVGHLVQNARDAMPAGGKLTLRTRNVRIEEVDSGTVPPGDYVALAVADTGVGMAPEILGHLFEPFFTTKEVGKGTGLGLASVYGGVKQAGGYIHLASEPGVGTTATIYLPRLATGPAGRRVVLLLQADATARAEARRILGDMGHDVVEAAEPAAALTLAARHAGRIDLLVADDEPGIEQLLPTVQVVRLTGPPDAAAFAAAVRAALGGMG